MHWVIISALGRCCRVVNFEIFKVFLQRTLSECVLNEMHTKLTLLGTHMLGTNNDQNLP